MPAAASALRRRTANSAFSSFMEPDVRRAAPRKRKYWFPISANIDCHRREPRPPPFRIGRTRGEERMGRSQFALLRQRRFLPFFVTQCFGAFNDNVYRQAIIGLLFWLGVGPEQRTLYTNLAPALFIVPYFLFSATAGQIAEKLEKSRLIRITTAMEIAIM